MAGLSKDELRKRKGELAKHARQALAKTEVMRFRLDPKNILQFCELAEKRSQHVGTMVREWVLERMQAELAASDKRSMRSTASKSVPGYSRGIIGGAGDGALTSILQRLDHLETEVRRLGEH
jgi:hypothetical protein